MRDRWYGDKRDVVKWSGLVHLARVHQVKRILQVAFYRQDEWSMRLTIRKSEVVLPNEVVRHFRDIEDISRLGKVTGLSIQVFKNEFQSNPPSARRPFRNLYFKEVIPKIDTVAERPLLVFLDPDTGIEPPKRVTYKHVTARNAKDIFQALKPKDILVLYQHAWRDRNWRSKALKAYANAIGLEREDVYSIMCDGLASDVALLVAERR